MHRVACAVANIFFAIVSTIIEKKSASMLPEGNGWLFFIVRKIVSMLNYIENGKTQGNAFIENSEQSMDKKSASMLSFLLLPASLYGSAKPPITKKFTRDMYL